MAPMKGGCHSERRFIIRFADDESQSRNLLLLAAIQQVSRLHKVVRERTILLRSK